MTDKPKVCRKPADAVQFWHSQVALPDAAASPGQDVFWIVTLNNQRECGQVFQPETKAFGDAERFADEVLSEPLLRYAKQILLIHHRPGVAPTPASDDTQRVRALIQAGREKGIALLDAVIVGQPCDEHPAGCFSFRQLANFESAVPFEGAKSAPATHSAHA